MGVAAYNRGSKAIRMQIEDEYYNRYSFTPERLFEARIQVEARKQWEERRQAQAKFHEDTMQMRRAAGLKPYWSLRVSHTPFKGEGCIRKDPDHDLLWIMNRREQGWGSFGYAYSSYWELKKAWDIRILPPKTDEHGEYYPYEILEIDPWNY